MGSNDGIAMQIVADLGASGHDCTWFNAGDENFDHSKFDVRSSLSGAHWLLIEASSFGKSESAASATGAAMVFAELEGLRRWSSSMSVKIWTLIEHGGRL